MRVVCEGSVALIATRVRVAEGVEGRAMFALKVVTGLRGVVVKQLMIAGGLVHYTTA